MEHNRKSLPGVFSERGTSLIEILYVIVIIGVLASISLSAYSLYKQDAEYAKAESSLRNARTAFEVGDQDAPDGLSVALAFSATTGGPVNGALATILPGAMVSTDVRLGAAYTQCGADVDGATINELLIAQPCKAYQYTTWIKLCNGTEIYQHKVPQGDVC